MSDGQHKLEEDQDAYVDLCKRFREKPQRIASGLRWDCYGPHAAELQRRAREIDFPKPAPVVLSATEQLQALLSGFVGANASNLVGLQSLTDSDWQRAAFAEVERRHAQLFRGLPTEILLDITTGRLDATAVVTQLAAELEADH